MAIEWEVGKTYKRRDGLDVFFVGYARDGSPVWESRSGTYTTNNDGIYHSHGQESTADVMPPLQEMEVRMNVCGGRLMGNASSSHPAFTIRHDGERIHEIEHNGQVIKVTT